MFGTILVPLDGSREAELAIPYAVDEARRHDCSLVLIHIVPRPEVARARVAHGGPASIGPAWEMAELRAAEAEVVTYLRDVVRRHGLATDTEIVTPIGDPYTRLQDEIDRRTRPLVVLAAGSGAGSHSRALDETARRVMLAGTAPLLRIQGTLPPSPRIQPNVPTPATQSFETSYSVAMTESWL